MTDYFNIKSYFTEEQVLIQSTIKDWVNKYVKPHIGHYYQKGIPFPNLVEKLAEIGALGLIIPEKYGGLGMDFLSYGLMMQELERGDTSLRVMSSIQTSLVMYAIYKYGSEDQKLRYLPKLASGELSSSFGLTEPNFGSNTSSMHCHFEEQGDFIKINGSKMWIGNSSQCDIAMLWAKGPNKEVRGIIVDKNLITNFETHEFKDKMSFKASVTGELIFESSLLPKTQILPATTGIKDAYDCLNIGRYAVAWGCIGIAIDCYETALQYSQERIQFGDAIAAKQLVQKKLAEMITEITKAQLMCYQLGVLMDKGEANYAQISMAKRNNVTMARFVASESRQVLGGMGISSEYPIMRHLMNLETLITYQGTHEIHLLITGRDITGFDAI
ncbi:MAG: acyl-CoA dehydrogenase family protein [Saprospiraceae bacterium]|nr:acyl-CoA dehydrogenase family protein [Saprospiraceae bacterium]